MDLVMLLCGVLLSLFVITLFNYLSGTSGNPKSLPPGKTGWPVIGESLEFLSNLRKGHSERFFFKRMVRYSRDVFKTSIIGDHVAVLCGAEGSKFLVSNTNKLVKRWLPRAAEKLFLREEITSTFDLFVMKPAFITFIKADGLRNFVGVMDTMAQHQLESYWLGPKAITVYPLVKSYTFAVACRLFLSIEDAETVEKLLHPLETVASGLQSLPIGLPGTRLNRALKAASAFRSQILQIVRDQRAAAGSISKTPSSTTTNMDRRKNLLTCFMEANEDDTVITDSIMGILLAGHETTSSVLCMIFKFLADYPNVYRRVYQENMEVASKKAAGELLNLEDTQNMRYTWNVAREVLRLHPTTPFLTREAMADFTYAGYHIPKGYKLITSIYAIHKDPKYFPEPKKFDPSRFDGDGPLPYTYIPFGGGPNMCPGVGYFQVSMLVFLHNALKRFKWETLIPNENITGIPLPKPAKGLPIRLHPLAHGNLHPSSSII